MSVEPDAKRESTLIEAIRRGDRAAVASLLAERPELAAARDEQGVQAPLLARYLVRADLVEVLLAARPELDLFSASALGALTRLGELLDAAPAAASAFAADGFYPLALAAFFRQEEAVLELLRRGADPNAEARNAMRVRPLHAAVGARSPAIVRALLAAGAEPNVRQQGGWTPLHGAAACGETEIVDELLAAGADPALGNDAGQTPLDLAREKGEARVVERLEAWERREGA